MYKRNGICIIMAVGLLGQIFAQNLSDLRRQKKEIQDRIEITNNVLRQNDKNKSTTLSKIRGIGQNINNKKKLIKVLDAELLSLDNKIGEIQKSSVKLSHECEKLQEDYANMVVNLYYAKKSESILTFILKSKSFSELIKKIRFLHEAVKYKEKHIQKIKDKQNQVSAQFELLSNTRKEKKKMLHTREREADNLKRDERKHKSMLGDIMKKEKNLKKELEQQRKLDEELNAKITKLVQQSQSVTTLTAEQELIEGDFVKNKGRLPWPVEKGFISRMYGKYTDPVYKNVTVNNIGIYIQTIENAQIRAVFKGEITGCYMVADTYTVIIRHGNHYSVYSGLKSVSVKKGQSVDTKQNLGEIYTNSEKVSELYFLVYEGKTNLNPALWITQ